MDSAAARETYLPRSLIAHPKLEPAGLEGGHHVAGFLDDVGDSELRALFGRCGGVRSVEILRSSAMPHVSRGFGSVRVGAVLDAPRTEEEMLLSCAASSRWSTPTPRPRR